MQTNPKRRLLSTPLFILLGVTGIVTLVLLTKHFFPDLSCPVREQTGILCPGCGGTTAVNYLLKGDFQAAFQSNQLYITGLLVLILLCLYASAKRLITGDSLQLKFSLNIGLALIAAIVIFTIVRNLV